MTFILTTVRTSAEGCDCKDPWRSHYGFIYDRGDGVRHYPQTYRSRKELGASLYTSPTKPPSRE